MDPIVKYTDPRKQRNFTKYPFKAAKLNPFDNWVMFVSQISTSVARITVVARRRV